MAIDPIPLTSREKMVEALLLQGLSNKEIAGRLGITARTAQFHASNVLAKAGASCRRELIAAALSMARTIRFGG
jgi:DNA-binding NarL/FixJ family response regulator